MARPSSFDRKEAVEMVMNEIWKNGYEASSVKSLSEKLGITRSSFYNAFGSREEMFSQVLDLYLSLSPDLPLTKATSGIPIRQLLTRTFRQICKVRAADKQGRGCLVINGVAELCNVEENLGPMLEQSMLGSITRMETLLGWAVSQKEIDPETDLHATALALQNLLIGLNVMCKVVRDENQLWQAAQTTLQGLGLYQEEQE